MTLFTREKSSGDSCIFTGSGRESAFGKPTADRAGSREKGDEETERLRD